MISTVDPGRANTEAEAEAEADAIIHSTLRKKSRPAVFSFASAFDLVLGTSPHGLSVNILNSGSKVTKPSGNLLSCKLVCFGFLIYLSKHLTSGFSNFLGDGAHRLCGGWLLL